MASIALPSTATLTGTTLVVPGLTLAPGERVTLLYVDDAGDEIPLSTWHADQPAGATYTAGDNIDISSANIISLKDLPRRAAPRCSPRPPKMCM